MRTCTQPGCGGKHHSRGLCNAHARQQRRSNASPIPRNLYKPPNRPGAQTTPDILDAALQAAVTAGKVIPCAGRDEWTSDDPKAQAAPALACQPCPVIQECRIHADTAQESDSTWGGIVYGSARSHRRTA